MIAGFARVVADMDPCLLNREAAIDDDSVERRDRLAQARAARAHRDPGGITGALVIFCGAAFFLFVMLVIFVLYETRLVRSDFTGCSGWSRPSCRGR